MGQISAKLVKKLRDKTGAGMMDCKRSLADADGDTEKAVELLRERGLSKAGKRGGRATSEGGITISVSGSKARAFIFFIDSLRYDTAIDRAIMPKLVGLFPASTYARVASSRDAMSVPAIRAAFSGTDTFRALGFAENIFKGGESLDSTFSDLVAGQSVSPEVDFPAKLRDLVGPLGRQIVELSGVGDDVVELCGVPVLAQDEVMLPSASEERILRS